VTEQDELEVVPIWLSEQLVELKLPDAAGEAEKLTVPVGDDFVPESVSETVAVQVVD
jgi:hypothetical protein